MTILKEENRGWSWSIHIERET